ncbi:MAG TPA: bifunctional UDP-N-acetylglucosamine diphosphorylase/glucosamine-1-phosphate N-acetyltransferase GlmU [Verrucomicrobiae bacterium]|nr:bifunctional UDP-N-acetylglucosamine diphosphorylase/glucosamine-1-phosphate N-acetyltransferase GlmU [Verrucomicrobiae bacterium]
MGGIAAVVMAAGKGTRMKSKIPKVLHQVCGKPVVAHVIDSLKYLGIGDITVVVGHGHEIVKETLGDSVKYAYQEQQLGTGHAVLQAKDVVDRNKTVLVVSGDTPLLTPATLGTLLDYHVSECADVTVLTTIMENPYGYGRVLRLESDIKGIVEEKDASDVQRQVKEINSGTYCFSGNFLFDALGKIEPHNVQKEYYLTDVIGMAVANGKRVRGKICGDAREIQGINSRAQLADAAKLMNRITLEKLMADGVTIVDPDSTYIEREVSIGIDSVIMPFSFLQGKTVIGEDCIIGPQTRIDNCQIGNGVNIEISVVKQSVIGDNCTIGPFAYLRPDTTLEANVKVGDFVEIKKSYLAAGSKVPHLSYIGDAEIGERVNIGAGTITCNYDGRNKYRTKVEDGAFIGSNTNLVAPVKVGSGAVVAAGSTITKDVPTKSLGVARSKQVNVTDWANRANK